MKKITMWLKVGRLLWKSYKTYKAMPHEERVRLERQFHEQRAEELRREQSKGLG